MSSSWMPQPLGDLCKFSGGGAFPKSEQGSSTGDHPFIKVSDLASVENTRRIQSANNWVSVDQIRALKSKLMPAGSVVFAKIGEGLKSERLSTLTRDTALDNNLMAAIPKTAFVDATFLYYLLSQVGLSDWAHGSALPYLRQSDLEEIPVLVPSLAEQRRIAGVLGALDDLIEVNQGLIQDLLKLADSVASSPAVEAETLTFGDTCDIFGGGTPSTKNDDYWGDEVRWATPSDITALPSPYLFDTSRRITMAGLEACSSKLFPAGTILMTSRATIGAFAITQAPTAVNQGFIAVEPRSETDRWFLFHEMRRRVPEFIQRANGSTFLELSRGVFKKLIVSWPSEAERAALHVKLDPFHRSAAELQVEIGELESTRDELLPLLMSGRVRVAEAVAA